MRILVSAAFLLMATPVLADQVTFKCVLQNADKGFKILATNPGPGPKTCTAECQATQSDGKLIAFGKCTKSVPQGTSDGLFCGNGDASKDALKDPNIISASCN